MTRGMASLSDPAVSALLGKPNHAVLSTLNQDGSVHTAMIWLNVEDDKVAINSQRGRVWPTNLERDGRTTLTLLNQENPYEYVEIKGVAEEADEGADDHIDALAKKYINQDKYPWRVEGEERVKFFVAPLRVRYVKAG
jgi:PPOX class probable F420-dependent enzyme